MSSPPTRAIASSFFRNGSAAREERREPPSSEAAKRRLKVRFATAVISLSERVLLRISPSFPHSVWERTWERNSVSQRDGARNGVSPAMAFPNWSLGTRKGGERDDDAGCAV